MRVNGAAVNSVAVNNLQAVQSVALLPVFANNISTTLSAAITSGQNSITLASGAAIPAVASGYMLTLTITQQSPPESSWEVIYCPGPIAAGATTLTSVQRGAESAGGVAAAATPRAWATGSKVESRVTAGNIAAMLNYFLAGITATTPGGASSPRPYLDAGLVAYG